LERKIVEHKISEATRRFLSDESRAWVDGGLISEGQRNGILESYIVTKRLPAAVLTLGVLMIGIGLLSFIAANWDVLPPEVKVVLIVGSYLSSVVVAYFFERRGRRITADALLLLSGFLLLGGLALIAQVFHIEGSSTGLLRTWLLVYAPTFLLVRNLSIYLLYEAVGLVYMNILCIDVEKYRIQEDALFDVRMLFSPYQPLLLMLFLMGTAWWIWNDERKIAGDGGSRLKKFFVGGSSRRIFFCNIFVLNWFTWLCLINSKGRTVLPFIFGVIFIGAAIIFTAWKLNASDLDWQGLLCVGLAGIALSFPWIWNPHRSYREGESGVAEAVLASALLCAYLVYRIAHRHRSVGFSLFLFCGLLARWYFDMFYSFMSKSIFFTLGGLALLLLAFGYRRWDKMNAADAIKIAGGNDDDPAF
jgi:uncharacterized membrane protein